MNGEGKGREGMGREGKEDLGSTKVLGWVGKEME